ncbi:uncharacterized protein LTR77_002706 [Saxophila tyrrhenica]|uniref:Uncharacterized protein n=1 Tax=Saxophila tyrrhenica TaxID=1690608 RepID=A0AAV9PFZ9_9PEZI|nr:hypothetical protein LTR77_002706 [Saxophila tyrrhenica]
MLRHMKHVFSEAANPNGPPARMENETLRKPALRSLRCRYDKQSPEIIQSFLQSFSGLELVLLESSQPWDFDLKCLDGHLDSLRHLCISLGEDRVRGHEKWRPRVQDLTHMLRRAPNIQQLAIPFPTYEHETQYQQRSSWDRSYFTAIADLANLQVLRCLFWPRPMRYKGDVRGTYHRGLQSYAETTVNAFARLYTE